MSTRGPILHLAPFLWSGAGGVITRLCEDQRRTERVVLATTSRSGDLCDWPAYRRRLRRAAVEHLTLDLFHREASTVWSTVALLADVIRDLRPRVIHAHAGVPTWCAVTARDLARVRVRVVGQMYSWGPDRPEWMNRQDLWGFARADRVVCSARDYEALLLAGGVRRSRLAYLPWGLPLDELPFRARPSGMGRPRAPRLGFVGRIEPRKGQVELVEAFARLRVRCPLASLDLVGPTGDAGYELAVDRTIEALGLAGAVVRHGMVRSVPRALRRWDLFVSLSTDEGQGLAILEAMALGVPVLARPIAGVTDFLTHGVTGLAVRGESSDEIAGDMATALSDATALAALAGRARRLVEQHYDWRDTVQAFIPIYTPGGSAARAVGRR